MKILFVVTEDWFFRSHFKSLADRARQDGYQVLIAARDSGAMAGEDVRTLSMPFARRALGPLAVYGQTQRLQAIIDSERPDVIHAIALKPIALTVLARARGAGRALALTGRGYLALKGAPPWTALIGSWFRRMLRGALDQPRTVLLVENLLDKTWVEGGRALPADRVLLMPGAGVDEDAFIAAPEPSGMPIVVGIVSRLIRSKGIDMAVAAVARLRERGLDIVLRIAGDADRQNPEHVRTAEIEGWRVTPGVELVGRISDVASFWTSVHIACLPSRGGEGLPRSLLEAAACGRPIVTTDVPGCVDFVGNDAGIVTPREDVSALAGAIEMLALNAELRRKLGASGRAKVERSYTTEHAAAQASQAWARVSGGT